MRLSGRYARTDTASTRSPRGTAGVSMWIETVPAKTYRLGSHEEQVFAGRRQHLARFDTAADGARTRNERILASCRDR